MRNQGRSRWYPYYAGFSGTFVKQALSSVVDLEGATILDPWNGSGTTSDVAAAAGHYAVGYDLNPVMVIVAKARAIDHGVIPSIPSLLEELRDKSLHSSLQFSNEPLGGWLSAASARFFRRIERAIHSLLIGYESTHLADRSNLDSVSTIAAFFYVALFQALQSRLGPFRSSNPTWIKSASDEAGKLTLSLPDVLDGFSSIVLRMLEDLCQESRPVKPPIRTPTLNLASSHSLPVGSASVDVVITSPPYCTRIDYVIKTLPELALLGASAERVRALRNEMIGTPTINSAIPEKQNNWGPLCIRTLDQVWNHDSVAARSYYWKTYAQYFNGMADSLKELDRTLKPGGRCLLVAQDSYFKDVHIDLAGIFEEIAADIGWKIIDRVDFRSGRTMADINTSARFYSKQASPAESVLAFEKAI